MRRTTAAFVLALPLLAAVGCDRLDNFDVIVSDQATIQGAPIGALGALPGLDAFTRFDLSQSSDFQNRQYSIDDVDRLTLTRLTLRRISPNAQDLAFFGTLVLSLEADGLPKKEIARASGFAAGQTTKDMIVTPDDLRLYLLARQATLTADALDSRPPPQDTVIELEAVFDVDVNVSSLL
jgi:hypothetical protein